MRGWSYLSAERQRFQIKVEDFDQIFGDRFVREVNSILSKVTRGLWRFFIASNSAWILLLFVQQNVLLPVFDACNTALKSRQKPQTSVEELYAHGLHLLIPAGQWYLS